MYNVILAEHSGFCFGVNRAVEIALEAANKYKGKRIATWGSIVHNQNVGDGLRKTGIELIEDVNEISSYDVIIFRAHGMEKSIEGEIIKQGKIVEDAVCPFVKNVRRDAINLENDGYKVIIVGDEKHAEIKGVSSHLKEPYIVSSIDDIMAINLSKNSKLGVVAQTTFNSKDYNALVNCLKQYYSNVLACDTICTATQERQEAARKVAEDTDIMIVIGGYDSANTKRLVEICEKYVPTTHIETASELPVYLLNSIYHYIFGNWDKRIGVTAGASTPKKDIAEVIKKINSCNSNPLYLANHIKDSLQHYRNMFSFRAFSPFS